MKTTTDFHTQLEQRQGTTRQEIKRLEALAEDTERKLSVLKRHDQAFTTLILAEAIGNA